MWITDDHQTGISRYSASVYRAFSKVLYNMISYDLSTKVAAEVLELCLSVPFLYQDDAGDWLQ